MSPGHESKLRKWMAVNGKKAPVAGFHEAEIFSQANELAIPGYPGLAPGAFPSSSSACRRSVYLPRQCSQSTAENGLNLRYSFRASTACFLITFVLQASLYDFTHLGEQLIQCWAFTVVCGY